MVGLAAWLLAGCSSDDVECAAALGGCDEEVVSISLEPEALDLCVGDDPAQLEVIAHYSSGSTEPITDSIEWSSDDEAVATVDDSGAVTAVAEGNAVVTADYGLAPASALANVTVTSCLTRP